MHVVSLTAPVDTGEKAFGVLPAGQWILEDRNSFELAMLADWGTVSLSAQKWQTEMFHPDWVRSQPCITDDSDRRIYLMRSGAIGDLLLLTPAIRALKKKYPSTKIYLSCRKNHWPIFDHTGLIDELVDYPIRSNGAITNGKRVSFPDGSGVGTTWFPYSLENVLELAHDTHATDAFAKALGVTVGDYKPAYVATEQERILAASQMMLGTRPRVGMQLRTSTRNRDYPAAHWAKIILGLVERGWEVFLFGTPGQIPPLPPELTSPYIHDMSQSGLTFRQTAAILSLCNAFVGVDSALIHLCHALDVPAIGLYGPFPWQIRTAKAPLTHALSGVGECAPCFWHAKLGKHFPPNKPCSQIQQCVVMNSIDPDRVIAKVSALKP